MNYYTAKFKRIQKAHPTHWLILPTFAGYVELVYVGPPQGMR